MTALTSCSEITMLFTAVTLTGLILVQRPFGLKLWIGKRYLMFNSVRTSRCGSGAFAVLLLLRSGGIDEPKRPHSEFELRVSSVSATGVVNERPI